MYKLFAWYEYYPSGGYNDLVDFFETEDSAIQEFINSSYDFGEIIVGDELVRSLDSSDRE